MPTGPLYQLADMIALEPASSQRAEEFDFYLTNQPEVWETQIAFLGNGHCVPLVQAATGVPVTTIWRKGPGVRGNYNIPRGTAIATFNAAARYPNLETGNHAALFVELNLDGIVVVDQWQARTPARPGRRLIRFRGGADSPSDDGDQFSVIVIPKRVSSEDIRAAWLSLIS